MTGLIMQDPNLSAGLPTLDSEVSRASRILIVEDEQIIALNLRESLESMAYVVVAIASSGEKAVEKARELLPDLVLMDIRLTGNLDGIQAAEQIWTILHIPVIYVTGHSDSATLERAKLSAPFGYILKPIKEKELYISIEMALQRCARERLLLSVFRGMGDGVIVADTHHRITFLNAMAEQLTGWSQPEAWEQPLTEVFQVFEQETQQPIVAQILEHVFAQDNPIYLDDKLILKNKDGRTVPIADSMTTFRDHQGQVAGVVIVFRDITQRLLAEERDRAVDRAQHLELQITEMQRLAVLKEDFLSTVSHELRTPLSNIQMATRMLTIVLDQLGMLAQESEGNSFTLSRYINILQEQSQQELNLVNDLLDIQRINAESYPLDLAIVQLQDWLPHVLDSFSEQMAINGQYLEINIPSDFQPIQTDTHLLTRIVMELVNNACKYTPPQEQITVTVHGGQDSEPSEPLSYLMIEVCNSGVEISEEEQEHIFEPFYRIPQRDRWARGGTGLGLALVRKFAKYLGGSAQIKTVPNHVCFQIRLPLDVVYPTESLDP